MAAENIVLVHDHKRGPFEAAATVNGPRPSRPSSRPRSLTYARVKLDKADTQTNRATNIK
jgi:hypothetical protein